ITLHEAAFADRSQRLGCAWRHTSGHFYRNVALSDCTNKELRDPVTSPPLPVPRPGSRAAASPPGGGRTFFLSWGCGAAPLNPCHASHASMRAMRAGNRRGWGLCEGRLRVSTSMMEAEMQQRLDAMKVSPGAYKALAALQGYIEQSALEKPLLELMKIRASQINGCAYCLVMHTNDARKHGESDERMHLLNAWREAPVFTARERAETAWVEAVTLVADGHVPDEAFDMARAQFSEKEL